MQPNQELRRRVVILATQRYVQADTDWQRGLARAAELVPGVAGHGYWQIGSPGSRIRALYDRREQALQRLAVSRMILQAARDGLR